MRDRKNRPYARISGSILIGLLAAFVWLSTGDASLAGTRGAGVPQSFTELAEMAGPAVVNVRALKTSGQVDQSSKFFQSPQGENHPWKKFFEDWHDRQPGRKFERRSQGTGFIISRDGYIITNNHVIRDADEIEVKLKNGKDYKAEIIGRDPKTDLALLKIKAKGDLPALRIGNSGDLKVGEWVLAIGSPFGLSHTVTAGIVSAKGRYIGAGQYDNFIQTDASINPGNSGGPLIDMDGDVGGINTAIHASGQGIGFAIPIDLAMNIINQLKEKGVVERGWMGIAIQNLDDDLAQYHNVPDGKGAFIGKVFKGDPADQAGLKAGDIIIKVGDQDIDDSHELSRAIADIPVGNKVVVIALRKGKKKKFKVDIRKRDEFKVGAIQADKEKDEGLGLDISGITPDLARRLELPDSEAGVVVVGVLPGSKAQDAGFRPGDIIKEINHNLIESAADYNKAVSRMGKGDDLQFFVRRANGFMVIKMKK